MAGLDGWVGRFGGGPVEPRVPGQGALKPIEDAPGSYVNARASE